MARHRQFLIAAFAFVMFTQVAQGFTRRAFAWYPGTGSTSIPSGSLYARSSHGDRVDVERTGQGGYIVSFRGLARWLPNRARAGLSVRECCTPLPTWGLVCKWRRSTCLCGLLRQTRCESRFRLYHQRPLRTDPLPRLFQFGYSETLPL